MRIKVEKPIVDAWAKELKRAGPLEIGGVLFGEQISEGCFRIVEAKRQHSGRGSAGLFHRRADRARKQVLALHQSYGGDPTQFNYLGEWHSHPGAPVLPSLRDEITMRQLLSDQAGAVNFLVLAIIRLSGLSTLQIGAWAYLTSRHRLPCQIEITPGYQDEND